MTNDNKISVVLLAKMSSLHMKMRDVADALDMRDDERRKEHARELHGAADMLEGWILGIAVDMQGDELDSLRVENAALRAEMTELEVQNDHISQAGKKVGV